MKYPFTISSSLHGWHVLLATLILLLSACSNEREPVVMTSQPKSAPVVSVLSHRDLARYFAEQRYEVQTLAAGVPPFVLERFPDDLQQIEDANEKKQLFFLGLLPMVLIVNDELNQRRSGLQQIFSRYDSGQELRAEERSRLQRLTSTYLIAGDPLRDTKIRQKLLERIDIIPPAMVLAQAATESGYGTSRFARIGNNLFGMYTFNTGTGMIPRCRPDGRIFEVRRFRSVLDSVRYYMHTLNTHDAYSLLRRRRALHRALGDDISNIDLTDTLTSYSERGDAYIRDIRIMIRSNRLTRFTKATLRPFPPQRPTPVLSAQVESTAD